MTNPNAFAAALTGVFAWAITRIVQHYGWVDVTPDRVILFASGLTTIVLWVGREGIYGALLRVWHGAQTAAGVKASNPPPAPPA